AWLELLYQLVDRHQVHFETVEAGSRRVELQPALLDPRLEVQANRAHVAGDLPGGFLEGQVQAALAALARGVGEVGGHAALAAARGAADEDSAATVVASAAEHGVQAADAGGNALVTDRVLHVQGRDGQETEAALVDEEGVLVRPVGGTPILNDAKPPGRNLLDQSMVEQDHAVRDV